MNVGPPTRINTSALYQRLQNFEGVESVANSQDNTIPSTTQPTRPTQQPTSRPTEPLVSSPSPQSIPATPPPADLPVQPQPTTDQSFSQPAFTPATPPQESALMPGMYKPLPEEVLLEWIAPSRPFHKPNRRFFTTITTIGILIGLILFFANQMLPVAVVVAVVFLSYVLFSIPPGDVRHRLTTYGVRIEEQLYYWEELGRFWFTQQYKSNILHIEVARFPNTIHLLLGDIDPDIMKEILSEVLLFERPPLTPVEKAGKWLQEKVPLDLES